MDFPTEQVISGRCLCGEITFVTRVSDQYGADQRMGVCHCERCRRWSGAAGLPFLVTSPDHFRVTHGEAWLAHYRDDDATLRAFCRCCGSSLYHDLGSTYYVAAGAIAELTLSPGFHIRVADKAPWEQIADEARQYDEGR